MRLRNIFNIVRGGLGSIRDQLRDRDVGRTVRNGLGSIRDQVGDELRDGLNRFLNGGENDEASPTQEPSKALSALIQELESSNKDLASEMRLDHLLGAFQDRFGDSLNQFQQGGRNGGSKALSALMQELKDSSNDDLTAEMQSRRLLAGALRNAIRRRLG